MTKQYEYVKHFDAFRILSLMSDWNQGQFLLPLLIHHIFFLSSSSVESSCIVKYESDITKSANVFNPGNLTGYHYFLLHVLLLFYFFLGIFHIANSIFSIFRYLMACLKRFVLPYWKQMSMLN